MRAPMVTICVRVPDDKWNEIEEAIANGQETRYQQLIAPLLTLERSILESKGQNVESFEKKDEQEQERERVNVQQFLHHTISYDFPASTVMDIVERFAKENDLSSEERNKLRDSAKSILENYEYTTSSNYNADVRISISDADLAANLSYSEEAVEDLVDKSPIQDEIDWVINDNNRRDRLDDAMERGEISEAENEYSAR